MGDSTTVSSALHSKDTCLHGGFYHRILGTSQQRHMLTWGILPPYPRHFTAKTHAYMGDSTTVSSALHSTDTCLHGGFYHRILGTSQHRHMLTWGILPPYPRHFTAQTHAYMGDSTTVSSALH